MMSRLPADQAGRDRALTLSESFHLEAPAGSGKTSVLLARFLALLARVHEPEDLLALTFSRKAAGELRVRVMQLLKSPPETGPDASPLDRRLAALVEQVFSRHGDDAALKLAPERLPIMTFHSFCARLLRLAPQAGVPPDFELLEERDSDWVKQEALEELRRRLAARPHGDGVRQALIRRLVRLNNDWPRLARELRGLIARRDSLEDFLRLAQVSRDPGDYQELLEERFRMVLASSLKALQDEFAATPLGRRWPDFWAELDRRGADRAKDLPPQVPGVRPEDLAHWQALAGALLTKDGEPRKQLTPKYGFPPDFHKTPWGPLVTELPPAMARRLKECLKLTLAGAHPEEVAALQDLVILLGEALTVYEEMLRRRRALDFIALERAALSLLDGEDPGELLLRLDYRLKHLLVDEFQDTSRAQMTLLCRLISGWEAGNGRTLTVVGDPKQSIYGWRQAKVGLFLESRRGLPCPQGRFPLEPLILTANFRATRTLIEWTNQVFGNTVMPGASSHERVEFHAATPGPGAAEGESPYLALFPGSAGENPREAEARWLAGQAAQAAAGPPGPKVGILLFARTHLPVYLKALRDAGLAVKVREGLKLADSLVVRHLHNLAHALVRPQDDVAWAGVLRGPWSAQPLEILARVARTPEEGWPQKFRRYALSPQCPKELGDILNSLLAAREQVGRRPLAEVIQSWLDSSRGWQGLAAWEGPGGVANARAYLDLLAEADAGLPEETLARADFYLQEAYQPPDPRAQDSPVEILTVHRAKGLEFDEVIIPFLDWNPLKGDDKTPPFLLEEIPGTGRHGLALARAFAQEHQSSFYELLKQLRNPRILNEARRVFYVAATRARFRLTMSAVIKPDSKGHIRVPADSPLGWLWQHYGHPAPAPGAFVWPHPEIHGEVFIHVPPVTAALAPPRAELPPAWDFTPEAAPYQMQYPSRMAREREEREQVPGGDEAGTETAMIRGRLIHLLLETLALSGDLPAPEGVAAALRREGLAPEAAQILAPEILAEAEACRRDPFLGRLLDPHLPFAAREWLLEDQPQPGAIRRGIMDLLAFDGREWWLLDYKTSRPEKEEDWEEFVNREKDKYTPQLRAYQEMAARARGVPPPTIRLGLYFTACRRLVEVG